MPASVVDIRRGEFARDLVAVAKIHLRTTCLFAAGRETASRLLQGAYAESLWHYEIRETAFAQAMWYLYDYAGSFGPVAPMSLDQWVVSEAITAYLQRLKLAGASAYCAEEYSAICGCLTVCLRANARFTSVGGWLPFVHDTMGGTN
jgi:hypothetical protein